MKKFLVALVIIFLAMPIWGETLQRFPLKRMITESKYIVIGTVSKLEKEWNERCGPVLIATVKIEKKIMMEDDADSIDIKYCSSSAFDHPNFKVGEKSLIFIKSYQNYCTVTQGRNGKLIVNKNRVNPRRIFGYSDTEIDLNDFVNSIMNVINIRN